MSHHPVIDGLEFAKAGSRLQGEWPVAEFLRLHDALRSTAGTLRYELRGVPEEQGRPALRLKVHGTLQLVCQRCLGVLEFPLRIEVSLHLAATQQEMDAEPLEPEGPESIVAGKEMRVQSLVEDEVLLAIPIAPRHESCEGGIADAVGARQTPFAALRGLISGTKH
ncbi:MAG TPA: YceD family protein [Burkholderiales bacterium]|nr:YceD family protein [Burkholderiales bacterium]